MEVRKVKMIGGVGKNIAVGGNKWGGSALEGEHINLIKLLQRWI